jgi:hypothetical protein
MGFSSILSSMGFTNAIKVSFIWLILHPCFFYFITSIHPLCEGVSGSVWRTLAYHGAAKRCQASRARQRAIPTPCPPPPPPPPPPSLASLALLERASEWFENSRINPQSSCGSTTERMHSSIARSARDLLARI